MSSLLILQDKNEVIMTSDTASSIKIENKTYRVSDTEKKIFNINKYKVFASGEKHIRDLFLQMIDEESFSPEQAETILRKYFLNFSEFCLEVVIAEKNKGFTTVYFLSSYNKFKVEKNVSFDGNLSLFTAGIKTREVSDTFESLFAESNNIYDSLYETYLKAQSEEVGGSIEIHRLSTEKVVERTLPSIELSRIDTNSKTSLIVGERIVGKIIMGTRLIIEDENGIIRFTGSLQEIFDAEGNVRVALGEYEDGKYGIKIDNGALEIVGGLKNGHLDPALVADLKDESKIRGDLRLTAPLPSNLSLNSSGITATQSTNANNFARMDYRGLYVQGGAVDIRTSYYSNQGVIFDGNGLRAVDIYGKTTINLDTNGNATFSGNLNAATGTFSGMLNGASGTFTGTISASQIESGGTITGIEISGGTVNGATILSNDGTTWATITGGVLLLQQKSGITGSAAYTTSLDYNELLFTGAFGFGRTGIRRLPNSLFNSNFNLPSDTVVNGDLTVTGSLIGVNTTAKFG